MTTLNLMKEHMMEMDLSHRFASRLKKLNRAHALDGKLFSVIVPDNRNTLTKKMVIVSKDIKYRDLQLDQCPSGGTRGYGAYSSEAEVREELDKLLKQAPSIYFRWLTPVGGFVIAVVASIIAAIVYDLFKK